MRTAFRIRHSALRIPIVSLVLLALACCAAVTFANVRHTGSLSFPIDDGYIYSNYVLPASQGHLFTYNPGETSGGVTSLAWYVLCTIVYWLLAPFHNLLGGLAPSVARGDTAAAMQAGHLYLAAYLPGALCLAATALGVYRLACLSLFPSNRNTRARGATSWLLGAATCATPALVWGAMSGLEIALSTAVTVWLAALLVSEVRRGTLRWSLLLAALVPWVRPDLLAMSAAALLWLCFRAVFGPYTSSDRRGAWGNAALYLLATLTGTGLMSLVYYAGWGRPLPSSFYAKVGGLRLGDRFWFALQGLLTDRGPAPLVPTALAFVGGLLGWLFPPRETIGPPEEDATARKEASSAGLLLLLIAVVYVLSLMSTIPWFGQEERYLLPVYPFVILLIGLLAWRLLDYLPLEALLGSSMVRRVGGVIVSLLLVVMVYRWATQSYVVDVRNIRDAHIVPAEWIARNTPADSIVAAEPIGAVKLFSNRRTFDIVGLTSTPALGTFQDWPRAWEAIRESGATYLYFYPNWFDNGTPPSWAVEVQRFSVPDNRIAGDNEISLFQLRWDLYTPPKR